MIFVIDMMTMMQSDVKMERGWNGLNGLERMILKKIRIHLCHLCYPCSIHQKS